MSAKNDPKELSELFGPVCLLDIRAGPEGIIFCSFEPFPKLFGSCSIELKMLHLWTPLLAGRPNRTKRCVIPRECVGNRFLGSVPFPFPKLRVGRDPLALE